MVDSENTKLPITGHGFADAADPDACGPKAYVTFEETTIVATLKQLGEEARALRARIPGAADPQARAQMESELEGLRTKRRDLLVRQEKAWKRKMIMLGHLPEDFDD